MGRNPFKSYKTNMHFTIIEIYLKTYCKIYLLFAEDLKIYAYINLPNDHHKNCNLI